jgi:hypothetical protein
MKWLWVRRGIYKKITFEKNEYNKAENIRHFASGHYMHSVFIYICVYIHIYMDDKEI